MPDNVYKKRAKGDWCQGKRHKGDSEERQYAKNEIEKEIESDITGLVKHRGKRKRNHKAILEYRISWYEQTIEKYERQYKRTGDSHLNSLRDGLRVAQKEYKEKYSDGK